MVLVQVGKFSSLGSSDYGVMNLHTTSIQAQLIGSLPPSLPFVQTSPVTHATPITHPAAIPSIALGTLPLPPCSKPHVHFQNMVQVRKLSSTACAAKATSLALTVGSGDTGFRAAY